MPLNRVCLNRSSGPARFEVTRQAIDAFAEATLDDPQTYHRDGNAVAPPTMAFLPCWPVILEALADPDLGNNGQIIHGEQVMRWIRPMTAGDVLITTGTVASIETKGRNELYVLSLQTRDDRGRFVVEQDNICISLGTGAPGDASAPPARPKHAAPGSGDTQVAPLSVWRFSQTQVLPDTITASYAAASGDHNKVHLDANFARGLGFPGTIVHGMCLVSIAMRGVVHEVVSNDIERISELRVRFANPAQPGEQLTTNYSVQPGSCAFESFTADGRKILGAGAVALTAKEPASG